MNGLKKWMAIIMTSVTIMGNMTGQGIPVMGAEKEVQEVITSGNIYVTETGAKERVVRVNEDGSFVTEPVEEISSYVTNAPCEHPARYLEAVGKKTDFQTVGTAGTCYKERLIISNKCNKCQRRGIKTYSPYPVRNLRAILLSWNYTYMNTKKQECYYYI